MDEGERVGGESRAVLRAALGHTATWRRADGTLELVGDLPEPLGAPLARALERVVTELRDDDLRRGGPERSEGELRAAALMAVLLRVTDPGPTPP